MTPSAVVTRGHLRSLEQLERRSDYLETRALYAAHIPAGVYLRPTNRGFTVVSLDAAACEKMVGVGGSPKTCTLGSLPPARAVVADAIARYREKLPTLERGRPEDLFSLRVVARALDGDLELPHAGLYFVHQEWRLPGLRIDLVAVDPRRGRFSTVELKATQRHAERADAKKGGTALAQAERYARALHERRTELYPYFERLARALACHHGGPRQMQELRVDPEHVPDACVAWPGMSAW